MKAQHKESNISYLPPLQRILPQSSDAERGVLGSMLISPQTVIPYCIEVALSSSHFYFPNHAVIYEVLVEMFNERNPIDAITLVQLLRNKNQLDQVGGAHFVTELFTFLPSSSNFKHYLEIVMEKHERRQLIEVCTEYASRGYDESEVDWKELKTEFQTKSISLTAGLATKKSWNSIADLLPDSIDRWEARAQNKGKPDGICTGFPDLDRRIGGIHPGNMMVIGGEYKGGKSSLVRQMAMHIAQHAGATLLFSLEMSKEEIIDAIISTEACVDVTSFYDGSFKDADLTRISQTTFRIQNFPLHIRDEADVSIEQIRASARMFLAQKPIKLIVIDYLQIVKATETRGRTRQEQIAHISREIKRMAKELSVPVIVLSQLNKEGDTREASIIEGDCDQFLRIENPEPDNANNRRRILRLKRVRLGRPIPVELIFRGEYMRFESASQRPEPK